MSKDNYQSTGDLLALMDTQERRLVVKSTARYVADLRSNARALWSGDADFFVFFESMLASISRGFGQAWAEGAAKCGVSTGELSTAERRQLRIEVNRESQYVAGLADWIIANSRANGGLLRSIHDRLGMWGNRYVAVQSIAMAMACGDQKLEWVIDPAKESCPDCIRLNGIVKRASVWRSANIEPRMRRLDCKGYRCGCRFRPTTKPGTPGPLPRI